jgi:tRNA (guanosine-2'-O-)-methyltransferase
VAAFFIYSMKPTPKRLEKLKKVIGQRQPNLTVILENINDKHNLAACLRSCDAVGVNEVYILYHDEQPERKLGKNAAASATKWLDIYRFYDVEELFTRLRSKDYKIFTTGLGEESQSLYNLNLTDNVALCFGNEHEGVSEEAIKLADGNFNIPQMGMIQSLNISVACAVSLYEALRQRTNAGMYSKKQFNDSDYKVKLDEWCKKKKY